ncbi:MAG: serine hydrolase domain-containing protein [Gemmatimonadaceae bacterium]
MPTPQRLLRASGQLAFAALLCASPAAGQGSDRAQFVASVDSIVTAALNGSKAAAGMTVGVVRGKDTLLLKGYGYADLEFDVPTPTDAVYEIGSVTKQFTAASILQLVEQGKLSLDDELTKYLPSYNTQGHKVTIYHLLNHTSGIKGYTELPEFGTLMMRKLPRDSLVALFASRPFDFAPGEMQIYNNSAFFLLGLIIEKVSGVSYETYVKTHLFEPTGMHSSRYCDERAIQKHRAHGYDAGPAGLMVKGYLDQTWPYAAGSLCSTVGDLMAWNRALHGGRVLSPASYRRMTTPATLNDGTALRYGMGIALTPIAGHRAIHHGGGINGFLSESAYLPDDDVIVVVLINTAGPVSADAVTEKIVTRLLGARTPTAVSLDHPSADYAGKYRGIARGDSVTATVADSNGVLQLHLNQRSLGRLVYAGNDKFSLAGTLLEFRRSGGGVTTLHVDQGGGHYILTRLK